MASPYPVREVTHYCNIKVKSSGRILKRVIDFYDFTFVLEGELLYRVSEKEIRIQKNDAIFLPPGTQYSRAPLNTAVAYVSFNFHAAEGISFSFAPFLPKVINQNIRNLINAYPYGHLSSRHHSREKCANLLNYLLLELEDVLSFGSNHPHVCTMLSYIQEHFRERITLQDISRCTGLTKEYCACLFKQEMGKSIIDYMNERKMQTAKELILTGALSLTEISDYLGYENYNYFSRLFRKTFGEPPMALRKKTKSR